MANYGDVALNLDANWDRRSVRDQKYAAFIIGHSNGIADAALKEEPDKRHQFVWIDLRAEDELQANLSNDFEFVKAGVWTINEKLWKWDAEGRCNNQGFRLMARPAALYFAQQTARDKELAARKERVDDADVAATRAGIEFTDESGKTARTAKRR